MSQPEYESLFVALVLAPGTFSRNKNFELFEARDGKYYRRRAQMVRSLIKELTEPWPLTPNLKSHSAPFVESERLADGDVLLSYSVVELNYQRSAKLSPLEWATLNYALHQINGSELEAFDKDLVDSSLAKLGRYALEGLEQKPEKD